jgi:hypothetical protein
MESLTLLGICVPLGRSVALPSAERGQILVLRLVQLVDCLSERSEPMPQN